MTDTASFYDEIGAALQFPYYFGENLDALDECLCDLEWLPADRYLFVVQDAAHVLSADGAQTTFETWLEILARARETWATPVAEGHPWIRAARTFTVVMHATVDDAARLRARLSAAHAAYDERPIA
jgi:RNAse (barnase) inhibitor barstar